MNTNVIQNGNVLCTHTYERTLSVAFLFHLSPRLCQSTAGCSPPSMSSIVFCLLLSCFTFHLGFVHPLQDVALHQCLPLSSVCCFPVPGGSLLPCYVVFCLVVSLISSLSVVATLCSVWSTYCPSFLLYRLMVQPLK